MDKAHHRTLSIALFIHSHSIIVPLFKSPWPLLQVFSMAFSSTKTCETIPTSRCTRARVHSSKPRPCLPPSLRPLSRPWPDLCWGPHQRPHLHPLHCLCLHPNPYPRWVYTRCYQVLTPTLKPPFTPVSYHHSDLHLHLRPTSHLCLLLSVPAVHISTYIHGYACTSVLAYSYNKL